MSSTFNPEVAQQKAHSYYHSFIGYHGSARQIPIENHGWQDEPYGIIDHTQIGPLAWGLGISQSRRDGSYVFPSTVSFAQDHTRTFWDLMRGSIQEGKFRRHGKVDLASAGIFTGLNLAAYSEVQFQQTFLPADSFINAGAVLELAEVRNGTSHRNNVHLLFGGYRNNAPVNFATLAHEIVTDPIDGAPVVIANLPGHGASTPVRNIPVYFDDPNQMRKAVQTSVDYVASAYPNRKIHLTGFSLGGLVLLDSILNGNLKTHARKIGEVVLMAPNLGLIGHEKLAYDVSRRRFAGLKVGQALLERTVLKKDEARPYNGTSWKSFADTSDRENTILLQNLRVSSFLDSTKSPRYITTLFDMIDRVSKAENLDFWHNGFSSNQFHVVASPEDNRVDGKAALAYAKARQWRVTELSGPHAVYANHRTGVKNILIRRA